MSSYLALLAVLVCCASACDKHCKSQNLDNGCPTVAENWNSCRWEIPAAYKIQSCGPVHIEVVADSVNGGSKIQFSCPDSTPDTVNIHIGFDFGDKSFSWTLAKMNGKDTDECFFCRGDKTWREDSSDSFGPDKTWTGRAECIYRAVNGSAPLTSLSAALQKKLEAKSLPLK